MHSEEKGEKSKNQLEASEATGKETNTFEKFSIIPYQNAYKQAKILLQEGGEDFSSAKSAARFRQRLSKPPKKFVSTNIGDTLESLWNRELANVDNGGQTNEQQRRPNLARIMLKTIKWDLVRLILLTLFIRLGCILLVAEMLRQIIILIEEMNELDGKLSNRSSANGTLLRINSSSTTSGHFLVAGGQHDDGDQIFYTLGDGSVREGIYYEMIGCVSVSFIAICLHTILFSNMKLERAKCGLKCRSALSQMIYRKSERLSLSTSIAESSSIAIDLVANELSIIEDAFMFISFVLIGPIILILGPSWLAYTQTGFLPILAAYLFMLLIIILQFYLPRIYHEATTKRKNETKVRVEITSNFLNSIKVAKMYGWERVFRDLVNKKRANESQWLRRIDLLVVTDAVTSSIMFKILPSIIYLTCIYLYGEITSSIIFTTAMGFSNFNADGILWFLRGIKNLIDFQTSCKKIEDYLLLPEMGQEKSNRLQSNNNRLIAQELRMPGSVTMINCINLTLTYMDKRSNTTVDIVSGLNFSSKSGDLVMVIGSVGSGKSTLLLSLLREIEASSGILHISPKRANIAYASQEPWILAETIRNNILLGRPFDADRYKRVVSACSLLRDFNLLPQGDETLVGSKGVSLSGGQKARLNLARACYSEADIYLLDDPLSAVDGRVSRHIFDCCFKTLLRSKLVILATHQRQFMSEASQVIVLQKNEPCAVGDPETIAKQFDHLVSENSEQVRGKTVDEISEEQQQVQNSKPPPIEQSSSNRLEAANCSIKQEKGDSSWSNSVYLLLISYGHTRITLLVFILTFLAYAPLNAFADYYLRLWRERMIIDRNNPTISASKFKIDLYFGCALYALIALSNGLVLFFFQFQITGFLRRAAEKLHEKLMDSLFAAKMSFYDFCPSGELGSRYASDFTQIDSVLPFLYTTVILYVCWVFGFVLLIYYVQPFTAMLFVLLFISCGPSSVESYKALRLLVQYSNALRGSIYTNLSTLIQQLDTIRSDSNYCQYAREKFNESQDNLTSILLLAKLYETRLSTLIKVPILIVVFVSLYTKFIVNKDDLDPGSVGVLFMFIMNIVMFVPLSLEFVSSIETSMTSVNSVRQLMSLEAEKNFKQSTATGSGDTLTFVGEKITWPMGRVEFNNVSLRYFADEKPVLNGLTFAIEGGQRVGVVGRTGAGKSSIVSVLFRLYPFEGCITIDGLDISTVHLSTFRSSIGVIPQDPVLFCDSLRKNLDPAGEYTDLEIWKALQVVNLRQHVLQSLPAESNPSSAGSIASGLEFMISEGGRNFSVGQRQLVCLARAVLKRPRILIMDEATANVDLETDLLIQETIKTFFKGATIITVAHRLNTVLDYDKILVLDGGEIVEFDSVERLLAKEGGLFKRMVMATSGESSGK